MLLALQLISSQALAHAIASTPLNPQENLPAQTVTVLGKKWSKENIRDWVRSISPYPSGNHPIPRFNKPICFSVAGLPRSFAISIADRMAEDAERVPQWRDIIVQLTSKCFL